LVAVLWRLKVLKFASSFCPLYFRISGKTDTVPNLMIRHKDYKLIIPRVADADLLDMLYYLGNDPDETVGSVSVYDCRFR